MNLSFVRVSSVRQAMKLRQVRNECREGMTHFRSHISRRQQIRWWLSKPDLECYLLMDGSRAIGYGVLKPDLRCDTCGFKGEDHPGQPFNLTPVYWMTAGLVEEYRGQGLSRMIIALITELGYQRGEVWIDVWEDNLALRGDIRVGYEVQREEVIDGKRLLIMKHNRDRQLRPYEQTLLYGAPGFLARIANMQAEVEEVDAISRSAYSGA